MKVVIEDLPPFEVLFPAWHRGEFRPRSWFHCGRSGAPFLGSSTCARCYGWLEILGLAGLFLALGHSRLLLAYRRGRTASVAPFFYCFALWGVMSGFIIWGELPNAPALAGIALIAGSGVAIVVLNQQRGRKKVALADAL